MVDNILIHFIAHIVEDFASDSPVTNFGVNPTGTIKPPQSKRPHLQHTPPTTTHTPIPVQPDFLPLEPSPPLASLAGTRHSLPFEGGYYRVKNVCVCVCVGNIAMDTSDTLWTLYE